MRLEALDRGHRLGTKALLAFVRAVSRQRVPDVVKTLLYRHDFLPMNDAFQTAMRKPSAWSVAERETMAAFVSKVNDCEF